MGSPRPPKSTTTAMHGIVGRGGEAAGGGRERLAGREVSPGPVLVDPGGPDVAAGGVDRGPEPRSYPSWLSFTRTAPTPPGGAERFAGVMLVHGPGTDGEGGPSEETDLVLPGAPSPGGARRNPARSRQARSRPSSHEIPRRILQRIDPRLMNVRTAPRPSSGLAETEPEPIPELDGGGVARVGVASDAQRRVVAEAPRHPVGRPPRSRRRRSRGPRGSNCRCRSRRRDGRETQEAPLAAFRSALRIGQSAMASEPSRHRLRLPERARYAARYRGGRGQSRWARRASRRATRALTRWPNRSRSPYPM